MIQTILWKETRLNPIKYAENQTPEKIKQCLIELEAFLTMNKMQKESNQITKLVAKIYNQL